ncbi:porin family protein [Luteimonas aestuarii]|uniref:Porin family protein n=1 Tax=Luteimonas aestuarii TaxID=453837 RepID=A0A4R5TT95_9GAMM|nr:outer membrane beta-barrel protein [Luteimonas aestuarii]TDK24313.1 porin family protein [Luteimonas aestuarii]
MKHTLALGIGLAVAATAAPAFAQSADGWTGGYVGGHVGRASKPDDGEDRFLFDTNLDGNFNDVVRTAAGADAFSPGFCNGVAEGATPAEGCRGNSGGADWGLRAGYDWQVGDAWVFGVVGEYAMNDIRDGVTAYSTTPAFYTMLRKVDHMYAIRARGGFAFGERGENLVYATAGPARARVENVHLTSNGVNTFTDSGDHTVSGRQWGVGYERLIGDNFSIGVEYLMTELRDRDYRVRASGPAPATNPFILVDADGTDFRRSDEDLDFDSLRVTASWRF